MVMLLRAAGDFVVTVAFSIIESDIIILPAMCVVDTSILVKDTPLISRLSGDMSSDLILMLWLASSYPLRYMLLHVYVDFCLVHASFPVSGS